MQLINKHGLPVGISFRKHGQNPHSYVFRVTLALGKTTDIGADANHFEDCYRKAVDRRIDALDTDTPDGDRKALYGAVDAFKRYYEIELECVECWKFKERNKS
jgi:hypothetical protein